MNLLSLKKLPRLIASLRPSREEIESYAGVILQHEGHPPSALPDCRREAELQLWAERSLDSRHAAMDSQGAWAG